MTHLTPKSNNNKPNGEITRIAVVTGSSSGIGFETALLLARSGFHTYATMRNLEKSKKITEIANTEKLPLQVVAAYLCDASMKLWSLVYR